MNSKLNDFVFWFQLVMAWVFSVPQITKMFQTAEGITSAYFVCSLAFTGVNFTLAMKAYRAAPSRARGQSVWIYGTWVFLTVVTVWSAYLNVPWRNWDTWFMGCVGVMVFITLSISKLWKGLGYSDPIVRAIVGCICRMIPQLYMVYCMVLDQGGRGLALATILAGHVGILTRIAHTAYTARTTAFDRNLRGIILAETGNEFGWICVTVAWFWLQF